MGEALGKKNFSETVRLVRKGIVCFQCLCAYVQVLGYRMDNHAPSLGRSVAWICGPRSLKTCDGMMPDQEAMFQSDMAVLGFCHRCASSLRAGRIIRPEVTWFTSVRKARAALPLIAVMET